MAVTLESPAFGNAGSSLLTLGNLVLNFDTFEATIDGRAIELSYNEFELLGVLSQEPNRVLPYDVIVERLWKDSEHGSLRHLHVVVHRLRTKLTNLRPYEIRTVRGRGYGLVQPIGREAANDTY